MNKMKLTRIEPITIEHLPFADMYIASTFIALERGLYSNHLKVQFTGYTEQQARHIIDTFLEEGEVPLTIGTAAASPPARH